MHTRSTAVILATALSLAIAAPVSAAPTNTPVTSTVSVKAAPATNTPSDAERYGKLEQQSTRAQKFEGGSETVVVLSSGGLLLVILLIVLLVR